MKGKLASAMRRRRNTREFERALRDASPAMRQELMALAQRGNFVR